MRGGKEGDYLQGTVGLNDAGYVLQLLEAAPVAHNDILEALQLCTAHLLARRQLVVPEAAPTPPPLSSGENALARA